MNTKELHVQPVELEDLIGVIKAEGQSFKFMVIKPNQEAFLVKYFFYSPEKDTMLLISLENPSSKILSISASFTAALYYENLFATEFKLQFVNQVEAILPTLKSPDFADDLDYGKEATNIYVGPIHAGVIEPGHFHFKHLGEHIYSLDIKLGYLNRQIIKQFKDRNYEDSVVLAEHITGDAAYSYGLALTQAFEKILAIKPDLTTLNTRILVLEIERIYNHINDLAGLINDTGFALAKAKLSVLKELILQKNMECFGHRFLRGLHKLGAVKVDFPSAKLTRLAEFYKTIEKEFKKIINFTESHHSVLERFKGTGTLDYESAKKLSIAGLVGRASGLEFDARRISNDTWNYPIVLQQVGDVLARYKLRVLETLESFKIVQDSIKTLIGATHSQVLINKAAGEAWSIVESFRGDIMVYLELDKEANIQYCFMRDISAHNWNGIKHAVLGDIVADFPLVNKSFGLVYSGVDL